MESSLDWVILKVSQICNLDCSYCYVYNRGDTSWKTRPKFISNEIIMTLTKRIIEHCETFSLNSFTIEFHGGEPLTLGLKRFSEMISIIKEGCAGINLNLVIQTNGLLLTKEWIEFFNENKVGIGISIDGPDYINDANRVDHKGKGSTKKLLSVLEKLNTTEYDEGNFSPGFCCVVNPDLIKGSDLIKWFVQEGINSFDLLLPDGNVCNLPQNWKGAVQYGDFLIDAFDEWFDMGNEAPAIRKFELMIMGLFGSKTRLDSLGGDLGNLCVIETDGGINVNDVMRMCGGEFSVDNLNINTNSLLDKNSYFKIQELQELSPKCKKCQFLSSCGGGYMPHRFDGESFLNPSLYCEALYNLSEHILGRVTNEIRAEINLN